MAWRTFILLFDSWSNWRRVLTNQMGLVAVEDTKPAHEALRMCENGESTGRILRKRKQLLMNVLTWNSDVQLTHNCSALLWSDCRYKSRAPATVPPRQCWVLGPWIRHASPPPAQCAWGTVECSSTWAPTKFRNERWRTPETNNNTITHHGRRSTSWMECFSAKWDV